MNLYLYFKNCITILYTRDLIIKLLSTKQKHSLSFLKKILNEFFFNFKKNELSIYILFLKKIFFN